MKKARLKVIKAAALKMGIKPRALKKYCKANKKEFNEIYKGA